MPIAGLKIADTSAQDSPLEPAPSHRRWGISAAIGALLLTFIALFPAFSRWSSADASIAEERLRTASVIRGDLIRDVSVQGRVVAAISPTLYAPQSGTLTFTVEAGDRVIEGDVLATVDSPELTNKLAQEQARVSRLEIEVERQRIQVKLQKLENQKTVDLTKVALIAADRESRRASQAYEKDAISQIDYEKAHDERLSANLAHEHAIADSALDNERVEFELMTRQLDQQGQALLVEDLVRQVDELSIRSPVNGIVGNLLVDQKSAVSKNLPVVTVVDLSRFEIEAEVQESYADDLAIGMAAEVRTGSDLFPATLVAVSPEIIDNQVTIRMRFDGQSPAGLRQNQRLTTRILLEAKHDVLTVTRGQFLESGSGRIAYVIEDDVARRRAINVGARSLNAVEIVAGLKSGERIIVSSTEMFDGAETVLITN